MDGNKIKYIFRIVLKYISIFLMCKRNIFSLSLISFYFFSLKTVTRLVLRLEFKKINFLMAI